MPRMATALTLTGTSPALAAASIPASTSVQPVAPGEVGELPGVDGVEADVDPVEPGVGERRGEPVQPDAVGRHRDPRTRLERGDAADHVDEGAAQQRLAAGEPDLASRPGRRRCR